VIKVTTVAMVVMAVVQVTLLAAAVMVRHMVALVILVILEVEGTQIVIVGSD